MKKAGLLIAVGLINKARDAKSSSASAVRVEASKAAERDGDAGENDKSKRVVKP